MKIEGSIINNKISIKIDNVVQKLDNLFIFIDGYIINNTKLSDIKYIEKLYKEKSLDFVNYLDGNYNVFIVDNNKLFIIKDKLGNLPLYYYHKDGILFFSNKLSLIKNNCSLNLKINKQSIANYLGYSYIYESDTIYLDTYKLNKGSILKYDDDIKIIKYFDICEEAKDIKKNKLSEEQNINNLEDLLFNCICKYGSKNSKVGIFLSSGKDSTLLCLLASKYYKNKINTYTLGFEDEIDESENAKIIANYIGTNHHSIILKTKDVKKIINKIPLIYDEPFADPSIIPSIYMMENIKEKNDFYLAGEGVDGLFDLFKINNSFNNIKYYKELLYKYTHKIRIPKNYSERLQVPIIRRFAYSDNLVGYKGKVIKLNKKYSYEVSNLELYGHIGSEKVKNKNIHILKNLKMNYYTPFYDVDLLYKFMEYNNDLIDNNRDNKYIFSKVLYNNIDKKYFDNYKKNGFGIPIKKWMKDFLLDDIKKITKKDYIDEQKIFKYDELIKLINYYEKYPVYSRAIVLWNYYIFQLWYFHNIKSFK